VTTAELSVRAMRRAGVKTRQEVETPIMVRLWNDGFRCFIPLHRKRKITSRLIMELLGRFYQDREVDGCLKRVVTAKSGPPRCCGGYSC
jgi:hypothetical protein